MKVKTGHTKTFPQIWILLAEIFPYVVWDLLQHFRFAGKLIYRVLMLGVQSTCSDFS